jgi:hypothetical protein
MKKIVHHNNPAFKSLVFLRIVRKRKIQRSLVTVTATLGLFNRLVRTVYEKGILPSKPKTKPPVL